MIADQHADSTMPQIGDDALNVVHGYWIDSREGLVQHHELRASDERACDLQTPSFAAGQRKCLALAKVLDAQLVQQCFETLSPFRARERQGLEDRQDVVLH